MNSIINGIWTESVLNDVWVSTTAGHSWSLLTLHAPFAPRAEFGTAVNTNGVMVIAGGRTSGIYDYLGIPVFDDLWTSLDGGWVWYQLAATNIWSSRSWPSLVFDAQGLLYLDGGETDNPSSGTGTVLSDSYVTNQNFDNIGWMTQVKPSFTIPSRNGGCTGLICYPTSLSSAAANCNAAAACQSGQSQSQSSTLSGGSIAGIVVGVVAGVILCVLFLIWWLRSRGLSKQKKYAAHNESKPDDLEMSGMQPSASEETETA